MCVCKMASGLQEQLPLTLKHGGDTRSWTSIHRRCESTYDTLFDTIRRDRIHLVTAVDRELNAALIPITGSVTKAMKKLEMANHPTCHLFLPTYFVVVNELEENDDGLPLIATLKSHWYALMPDKYWGSITGTHILAFLDPTFRNFEFIDDINQRRQRIKDLDGILENEMLFLLNAQVQPQNAPA